MFLIPVSTDAPIYHFPWGTIGLISVNTLVWLASATGVLPPVEVLAVDYALVHGTGLHPVQWVTSNFLHAGFAHLLGNMMFLWPFGLIVEGKLGWQRFLAVYLGIGVVECLLEQACLRGPGMTLGASSIIFGLMAIACVWAPLNDIEVAYGLWGPFVFRFDTFSIPVLWLSALQIVQEVAIAAWLRFPIGSELFHLVGAALGAGVGLSALRAGLVDCEGWDILSKLRDRGQGMTLRPRSEPVLDGRSAELDSLPAEDEAARRTARKLRALKRIHKLLTEENAAAAWAEVQRTRQVLDDFQLGRRDLARLAQSLLDDRRWSEAIAAYEDLIARFPGESGTARLIVAGVLLEQQRRPTAALRHLEAIDPRGLTGKAPQRYAHLRQMAESLIESGVVELEGRAWDST